MRIKLISIFIFFYLFSQANDTINYKTIDKWSMIYYLQNDLHEINKLGRIAKQHDIDYYYLQMRIGIVNYNHKKYLYAIPHLKKAVAFNSSDTLALEYLYFSYLFSGNTTQALKTAKLLPTYKQTELHTISPKAIEELSFFSGYQLNTSIEDQKKEITDTSFFPFKQNLNESMFFYSIAAKHRLAPSFSVTQIFTSQVLNNSLKPFSIKKTLYDGKIKQNQYYLATQFNLFKKVSLQLGTHIAFTTTDILVSNNKPNTFKLSQEKSTKGLLFYTLNWQTKLFQMSVFNSISNFNYYRQIQLTGTLYLYPFGNKNVYTETGITWHKIGLDKYTYKQLIGFKIPKTRSFIELFYNYGLKENYSDINGSIIYNSEYLSLWDVGAKINIPLHKHKLNFSLAWKYENNDIANIYNSKNDLVIIPNFPSIQSKNQLITGGLTWKF